jgi:hypothetical protein
MPRAKTQSEALTIGQLARRWSVSVSRVRTLVDKGELPGTFEIPSAGRYGATTKIPLAVVHAAEQRWATGALAEEAAARPQRRTRGTPAAFRHFPELADQPEPVVESPVNGRR